MIFINLADVGLKVVHRLYSVLIEFCIIHINFYATFNFPKPICNLFMKKIFFLIFIFFSVIYSYGQKKHKLPEPQIVANSTPPPPPGLPIDFGIPGAVAGGLLIGIYFLRNRKVISPGL